MNESRDVTFYFGFGMEKGLELLSDRGSRLELVDVSSLEGTYLFRYLATGLGKLIKYHVANQKILSKQIHIIAQTSLPINVHTELCIEECSLKDEMKEIRKLGRYIINIGILSYATVSIPKDRAHESLVFAYNPKMELPWKKHTKDLQHIIRSSN